MIGPDVDKIHFVLFGLDLVEPNTLISDGLLGLLSLFLGSKIARLSAPQSFYRYWKYFLLAFGLSTFTGGFGHLFYNYLGILGKIPGWFFGIVSVYFIEISMISIYPNKRVSALFRNISTWKLFIVTGLMSLVILIGDASQRDQFGILVVVINSSLFTALSAGVLGFYYYKLGMSGNFRFFIAGVLITMPSVAVFLLDINPHPWFNKNDLSHAILAFGLVLFYIGLMKLYRQEQPVPYIR